MYMMHTTRLNPADTCHLMAAYGGIFAQIDRRRHWDDPLPFVLENATKALETLGRQLLENRWWDVRSDLVVERWNYGDDAAQMGVRQSAG
ncbi:TATE DNA transposon [Leptomonas pyrrhocoris]|uniref:TATE DNA transposon n=1 Tax=Leptomonas pyrrhocoris TaxID=157538 RepID=A0A0N0DXZ2_LEPPY|nr:TATE DNA transposon [Leptomonas pyrrhocoris]XP_015662912.1 TATE DNA transposon [Leptomonas pyrrhocoris]KPA83545.1 TATE DNA transposon [Leptomonas pyrrhocoris]KPA84473.1 TATE DNA transposon [Leptomonas pyrrhocoris]|eukprot:XP_015661984.1 TATE DNA transposon [Leptomonas pyrrhocoris]